ncbi:uncharacterized protein ARMOST_20268 [Armillaria ostoyae]|uniref:Uncharacterized protein n=1 Tax=Armillaria ostoyae TaxID=47428 RepID=A0A284S6W5_ARMOS|nr:uncharacterized protein ARMOST_20268 [Armillaria ostoyae]
MPIISLNLLLYAAEFDTLDSYYEDEFVHVEDGGDSGLTAQELVFELKETHRSCSAVAEKANGELRVPDNIYTPRRCNSFLEAYKMLLPSVRPIEDVRNSSNLRTTCVWLVESERLASVAPTMKLLRGRTK